MTREPISGKPPTCGSTGWRRQESLEKLASSRQFQSVKSVSTRIRATNRSLLHSVDRQDRHQESLVLQCQEW